MTDIQQIQEKLLIEAEGNDIYRPEMIEFYKLYLDPESPTYFNATQSAIKAFNYEIPRQYKYARLIGHKLTSKHGGFIREYLEAKGITLPKMIDIAFAKMAESEKGGGKAWWDSLMALAQYTEPKAPLQVTANTYNQTNVNLTEEEKLKHKEDYAEFLKQKYSTPKLPVIEGEVVK